MSGGQRQGPEIFDEPLEEYDGRVEHAADFIRSVLGSCPDEGLAVPGSAPEAVSEEAGRQSRSTILFERILDAHHIPSVDPDPQQPTVTIEIVGDQEMQVDGHTIRLRDNALYLWNALLLSRRTPRPLLALRSYGGEATTTGRKPQLGESMVRVRYKFERASAQPIILSGGTNTNTYYRLSPQVVLVDQRRPRKEGEEGYMPDGDTSAGFEEPKPNKHEVFEARDRDILAVVTAYEWHPGVQHALHQYWQPRPADYEEDPDLPLGMSPRDVLDYRLLSTEETRELFGHLEAGLQAYRARGSLENLSPDEEEVFVRMTTAYQTLYACNLRFVARDARHFPVTPGLSSQDNFQNGALGLATAIRHFDVTKGFKFMTYADWHIRQSAGREFGDTGSLIRLPLYIRTELGKLHRTEEWLEQELQEEPSPEQLAEQLGSTIEHVVDLQACDSIQPLSLDMPIDDTDELTIADSIAAPVPEPTRHRANVARITEAVSSTELTTREMAVLHLRFGRYPFPGLAEATIVVRHEQVAFASLLERVPGGTDLTLQEVGELLGVSRERIRQIEQDGLEKLQGLPPEARSIRKRGAARRDVRTEHSA